MNIGGDCVSGKIKKYVYPFIFSASVMVAFLVLLFFLSIGSAELGGVVIGLLAIAILFGVLLPGYCFVYGKKVLLNEKKKYIFTIYNSAVITLFYLLPLCMEGDTYIYSLILFVWCTAWTLLPLIIYRKQTQQSETNT